MFPPLLTQDFSGLPLGAKFHLVTLSMLLRLRLVESNLILCNILIHRWNPISYGLLSCLPYPVAIFVLVYASISDGSPMEVGLS